MRDTGLPSYLDGGDGAAPDELLGDLLGVLGLRDRLVLLLHHLQFRVGALLSLL